MFKRLKVVKYSIRSCLLLMRNVQIVTKIVDSYCKQKIFEDFAEYLFVYRKSDGDYLQTKVALQFISNAKNLIAKTYPTHELWVGVRRDQPDNWYAVLRRTLERN